MHLQTPTDDAPGVFVLDGYETFFPSPRELGGGFVDAVGVIAKGLMERRQFPDRSVDLDRQIGPVLWEDIRFNGDEQCSRSVGELT